MKSPNPEMVTLARESRALTQKEVAQRLGVTQGRISKIEMGLLPLTSELIAKLSEVLDYPQEFFFRDEPRLGCGPSELDHYRKKQSVSQRMLDTLHAQLSIRRMHIRALLANVDMETRLSFPRLDADEFEGDGARIARAVRAMWNVPRGPIRSVTALVEDAGGIVTHFDFGREPIDAISRQVSGLPALFFMNPKVGGARYRYTLAHELGHMVMHTIPTGAMEEQADAFAAEFLMPADDIRPMLSDPTLPKLASLTPHWRVSLAALLKRAGDLGRLSVRTERTLWMQMAAAGYKSQEPPELDFPVEEPTLLRRILDTHVHDLGYTLKDLADSVGLFEDELVVCYNLGGRGLRAVPTGPQRVAVRRAEGS